MIRRLNLKGFGVLLLSAALLHACSSEDASDELTRQWTVDIPVAEDATRGVYSSDGGASLKSKWEASQAVKAYNGSSPVGNLTAAENATGGSTTITGNISGTYTAGSSTLTLYSPAKLTSATYSEYATQNGSIEGISALDYMTATVNVTAVDAARGILATSAAVFQRQQSFTKFTFSTAVKTVKISATGMSDITVTAAADQTVFYVAMPLEGSVTYTFLCITNAGVEYRGTKTGDLTHGKYYLGSVDIAPGVGVTNTTSWGNNSTENVGNIYF